MTFSNKGYAEDVLIAGDPLVGPLCLTAGCEYAMHLAAGSHSLQSIDKSLYLYLPDFSDTLR